MKKIAFAGALIVVLVMAGSAFAGWGRRHGGGWHGGGYDGGFGGAGVCGTAARGGGADFMWGDGGEWDAVPQGIRDKWAESQKIAIDLRMELSRAPLNREKAAELHAKRRALMQEISDWRFNRRLDALSGGK